MRNYDPEKCGSFLNWYIQHLLNDSRPQFNCWVQLWVPHFRKDIEVLEHVQKTAMELLNSLKS